MLGLVVGLKPIVRLWDLDLLGACPPRESFKGILAKNYANFEENTENSERLDRQARPGFEAGTFRLLVLSSTYPPLVGPMF